MTCSSILYNLHFSNSIFTNFHQFMTVHLIQFHEVRISTFMKMCNTLSLLSRPLQLQHCLRQANHLSHPSVSSLQLPLQPVCPLTLAPLTIVLSKRPGHLCLHPWHPSWIPNPASARFQRNQSLVSWLSDIVQVCCVGVDSFATRDGFEIFVDPKVDPDIGEIVMIKKKKFRAALNGMAWGAYLYCSFN